MAKVTYERVFLHLPESWESRNLRALVVGGQEDANHEGACR